MVRSTLLATAAVSLSITATEASAHSAHQHHVYARRGSAHSAHYGGRSSSGSNVAAARGRGMAWCGAEMADELGIHGQQGRQLWIARNWAHVGTPTSAHVGAVVVWSHHVGRIVGQENGQWVVRSGNDGGGVRSRTRSLAGAIAIRDIGGGYGGYAVASAGEQPQRYAHVASIQRYGVRQHVAHAGTLAGHRTPLWMHEETVQPDRFSAAAAS